MAFVENALSYAFIYIFLYIFSADKSQETFLVTWKQKSKCEVAKRRQSFSGEDVAVSGTVEQTDVSADWAGGGGEYIFVNLGLDLISSHTATIS